MESVGARTGARVSASGPDFVYEQLKREAVRLRSFDDWDCSHISGADLARAGFFYIHESDLVQCAFCLGILGQWNQGDIPILEHRRCYSYCPFARGVPCGNVPMENDAESPLDGAALHGLVSGGLPAAPAPRSTGSWATPSTLNSLPVPSRTDQAGEITSPHMTVMGGSSPSELGITLHTNPLFPRFATFDSRLNTYEDKWASDKLPKPLELAEAGWYFASMLRDTDATACFHCGGVVQNWESTDNPWVEHARWFPDCAHVLLVKGKAFIDEVQKQMAEEKRPQVPKEEPVSGKVEEAIPDDMLCKICVSNKVSLVFLPCSHLCSCTQCAASLDKCPICREHFKGYVKVFF